MPENAPNSPQKICQNANVVKNIQSVTASPVSFLNYYLKGFLNFLIFLFKLVSTN